jgi:hypothetical protein
MGSGGASNGGTPEELSVAQVGEPKPQKMESFRQ